MEGLARGAPSRYDLGVRSVRQLDTVPAHLRRFVVGQDYEQYTEMDQAVWRFVLLQTYARLQHTAHPAYRTGLAATGIRVDDIPRIEEMNERLLRFGWSAVCVDGFIPPRAFQGFQANRILPIAAEIRSSQHLAYTPAPDIIHEAAGHAPILSEPAYAEFMQRFGAVAEKAFGSPSDRAVHQAVHALSELKENPGSTTAQIEAATGVLERALSLVSEVSESARLSRLYWWTAEYGLIGSVEDFRLYGAGLLSSLLESQSCLDAKVKKLPLSAECVELDYDITRAQPQLFVARDFEQLLTVLEEVSLGLAFRSSAAEGLSVAHKSEELATLTLDTGVELAGVVSAWESIEGGPAWVQLSGAVRLIRDGARVVGADCPNDYVLPLGGLRDGRSLSLLTHRELSERTERGVLKLELSAGMSLSGILRDVHAREGRIEWAALERFELLLPNGQVFRSRSLYPLAFGALAGVCAGAPAAYFERTEPSPLSVPRPRWFSAREQNLLSLYEQAVEGWKTLAGSALVHSFERITRALDQDHPDDWLLRWNLLESLVKVSEQGALSEHLTRDLELLEIKHLHLEPIATGLAHIRALAAAPGRSS
jgi:phenylalanine-4-hydroxylase